MVREEVVQTLGEAEIFQALTYEELSDIAALCIPTSFEMNQSIFRQGSRGESLYVITSGRVALTREIREEGVPDNLQLAINFLGSGRVLGWTSLVGSRIRPLSAMSLASTACLQLSARRLRAYMDLNTSTGYHIMTGLAHLIVSGLLNSYKALDKQAGYQKSLRREDAKPGLTSIGRLLPP